MKLHIQNLHDDFSLTPAFRKNCLRLLELSIQHVSVVKQNFELSLVCTTKAHIQKLNHLYRNKNTPTDVLSFAMDTSPPDEPGVPWLIGEIFISIDQCRENALVHEVPFRDEFFLLFIHSFLHLLGHDHDTSAKKKEMFSLQDCILREFLSLLRGHE